MDYSTLGKGIGISTAGVSRMINGQRLTPLADVAAALALCGVTGDRRKRLLWIAEERRSKRDGLLLDYGAPDQVDTTTLTDLETIATTITAVAPVGLPHLLDTQQTLTPRRGTHYRFLLTRHALTHPPEGRTHRLSHLVHLTDRPDIDIRITDTPPDGEPFQLMAFPDAPPAVAIRLRTALLFTDRADTVATYTEHTSTLIANAFNREASHRLIRNLAT